MVKSEVLIEGNGVGRWLVDFVTATEVADQLVGCAQFLALGDGCQVRNLLRAADVVEWSNMEFVIEGIPLGVQLILDVSGAGHVDPFK